MWRSVDGARLFAVLQGLLLVLGGCRARWTVLSEPVAIEVLSVKDSRTREGEARGADPATTPEVEQVEKPKFSPPDGMADAFLKKRIPEACFGARINLHWTHECRCQGFKEEANRWMRIQYCGDAFEKEVDLSDAIDVRLVPYAETVPVGEFVQVDLVIRNLRDTVLPIPLAGEIIHELDFNDVLRVVNEAGVDVTRAGPLGVGGSRGGAVLFALEPGGEARLPMWWSPVTIVGDLIGNPPRSRFRLRKLPPGEYTLSFKVPFYPVRVTDAQQTPSAKITVLPERLHLRRSE